MNIFVKTYDFFRYDLPRFFHNLWVFRKSLYYFRPDVEMAHLYFLHTSLMETLKMHADNRVEEDKYHTLVIEKIKRSIEIITAQINDEIYVDKAEKKLGIQTSKDTHPWEFTEDDMKIISEAVLLEELEWEELFAILRGQKASDLMPSEFIEGMSDNFDGSGLKHWGD